MGMGYTRSWGAGTDRYKVLALRHPSLRRVFFLAKLFTYSRVCELIAYGNNKTTN